MRPCAGSLMQGAAGEKMQSRERGLRRVWPRAAQAQQVGCRSRQNARGAIKNRIFVTRVQDRSIDLSACANVAERVFVFTLGIPLGGGYPITESSAALHVCPRTFRRASVMQLHHLLVLLFYFNCSWSAVLLDHRFFHFPSQISCVARNACFQFSRQSKLSSCRPKAHALEDSTR